VGGWHKVSLIETDRSEQFFVPRSFVPTTQLGNFPVPNNGSPYQEGIERFRIMLYAFKYDGFERRTVGFGQFLI
jgi:hypothetical protein